MGPAGNGEPAKRRLTTLAAAGLATAALAGCGGGSNGDGPTVYSSSDGRPAHVHGLAVVDDQVLAATHNGLWNVGEGKATRVGEVRDDLMGFTVAGEGRFLASGHPARPGTSPHLGLVESGDGGRSWNTVSLGGEADFHALAVSGHAVYGFDAGRLLTSSDGGVTWEDDPIGVDVVSLAMLRGDDRRVLAGTVAGVKLKRNGRWKTILAGEPALVSWPAASKMVAVALDGEISISTNQGRSWKRPGTTPGPPVAAYSDGRALIVAAEDGSIARSTDDGATWTQLLAAEP